MASRDHSNASIMSLTSDDRTLRQQLILEPDRACAAQRELTAGAFADDPGATQAANRSSRSELYAHRCRSVVRRELQNGVLRAHHERAYPPGHPLEPRIAQQHTRG